MIARFSAITRGRMDRLYTSFDQKRDVDRCHGDAARAMAIRAAREKADALAAELSVRRGKVYSINATEGGGWWSSRSAGMSQNVVQNAGGGSAESEGTLSIGQISVMATVNVSFLIE